MQDANNKKDGDFCKWEEEISGACIKADNVKEEQKKSTGSSNIELLTQSGNSELKTQCGSYFYHADKGQGVSRSHNLDLLKEEFDRDNQGHVDINLEKTKGHEKEEREHKELKDKELPEINSHDSGDIETLKMRFNLDNILDVESVYEWDDSDNSEDLVAAEYAQECNIKAQIPDGYVYLCYVKGGSDLMDETDFFMQRILWNKGGGSRIDKDYVVMRTEEIMEMVKIKKSRRKVNGKNLYEMDKEKIILPMYNIHDVVEPYLAKVLDGLLRVKRGVTTDRDIMFLTLKEGLERKEIWMNIKVLHI